VTMPESENPEIEEGDQKRDWRVSAILLAIWMAGVAYIIARDTGIPTSMLVISSAFFIFLIPAMNDLVRSIERRFGARNDVNKSTR